MNILFIADQKPKRSIKETIQEYAIDIIVTLGDLDFFDIRDLQSIDTIPKIGVYGNHCSGNYFESVGIKNMHLETFEFQGVTFAGFQGSVRYKPNPYAIMYHQEEALALLDQIPKADILISHAPPFGVHDEPDDVTHAGLKVLNEYLERHHPKYHFHGHTYTKIKETLVGTTKVVYIYADEVYSL
jgi:Icc-related predicted phosphoesterase